MAINKDKVFETLSELIETLKDGQNGFKTAADAIGETDIKSLFEQYARQRTEYINELQTIITHLGGEISMSGSIAGALHRGWIDLKSAVTSGDPESILEECEKGEDAAVKEYSNALKEDLPPDIKSIISDQYGGIKAVHDNVKHLRDFRKKS